MDCETNRITRHPFSSKEGLESKPNKVGDGGNIRLPLLDLDYHKGGLRGSCGKIHEYLFYGDNDTKVECKTINFSVQTIAKNLNCR